MLSGLDYEATTGSAIPYLFEFEGTHSHSKGDIVQVNYVGTSINERKLREDSKYSPTNNQMKQHSDSSYLQKHLVI